MNEISGSIKLGDFLEELSNYRHAQFGILTAVSLKIQVSGMLLHVEW
jgi:hypothetical protein